MHQIMHGASLILSENNWNKMNIFFTSTIRIRRVGHFQCLFSVQYNQRFQREGERKIERAAAAKRVNEERKTKNSNAWNC